MSAVVDAVTDLVNDVFEAIEDLVVAAWDSIVEPILEQVLAIFGITDETIVTVQKLSSSIYDTNVVDVVEAGITRAILSNHKLQNGFFPSYMTEIYRTKGQVRAAYRYAELNLYIFGLPEMEIRGAFVAFNDVQDAIDTILGTTTTVLKVTSHHPNRYEWFRFDLQQSPEYYKPWLNSLTATDIYGASWDDWQLGDITYNSGPDNYTIDISRQAEEAQFWISGPGQVTEGDTATYVVKSNRIVPTGETVDINFVYSGTAVDGVDYTSVASVTMLGDTDEIEVAIVTAETASAGLVLTITIDSIDNNNAAFEMVTIHAEDFVSTTITNDDALMLTMNDQAVDEANVTISVDVKLEQAAPSGAFDVDYNFTDLGGITGGVDYDNTTGTLNFAGTLGEVQTIMVDIYADIADDDREQFEIFLENSTDVDSIDISAVSTITIYDGTSDPPPVTAQLDDTLTEATYVPEDSLIITYEDDADPPGQWWYYIQPHSDMTYDLQPTNQTLSNLEMLPMAILRQDKTNIDVVPGTSDPQYITTRMLMMRLGLDIVEFLDAFSSNPDIDDVDDAYINFSMSPLHTNEVVSHLLYRQWFQVIVDSGLQSNIDEYVITIAEGDIENATVWKDHHYKFDEVGVVTTEGEYTHSTTDTDLTMQFQRTATNYDELKVFNLNGFSSIKYDGYSEVAMFKLGDDEFTIPLSWDTFNQLSATEQMEVYQYVLRLDFNAINITELEWYETQAFFDLFEFAMIVVVVVVTVYTLGTASSFTAGAWAMVQAYVVNYAIGELIIYVAEATGNEFLAAAIGVAAAIYLNNPEMMSSETLMQADTLITMSTEFANNLALLEDIEAQEMAEDIEQLNKEAQEKLDAEKNKRQDVSEVAIDSNFLAAIQSVDTTMFPAIQGQYEYDTLYDYDSLVGNWHEQQLQIGVR